jgi:FtsP/CotA-like multicopper oxidase with cupredoxin domain
VENTTLAPDGYERYTLTFNGTIPGPAIIADWGDNLVIHVTNNLEQNGTAIHWHGFRQFENSEYDGVPGVTQCPIAPGDTLTYKFQVTQYGSTWYHSHFTLQYADGLLGPMIVNGPATANYDEDLGVLMLSDWGHKSVFELWPVAQQGGPPTLENTLINGTNIYDCSTSTDAKCIGGGKRYETSFVAGKKYRIRLVNTAIDGHFRFSLDNHTFQVIAADLVPIVPYTAETLLISIGQRYDIIVEATAESGDFWLRAGWQSLCGTNLNAANAVGIVRYDASSTADPTTTYVALAESCQDEPLTNLVPYVPLTVGEAYSENILDLAFKFDNAFLWTINTSSLYLNWSDPTTLKIYNNESIFPTEYNVQPLTMVDEWVYWVIQDSSGIG